MTHQIVRTEPTTDQEKRNTLKLMGGAAIVSLSPSLAAAAIGNQQELAESFSAIEPRVIAAVGADPHNAEIEISLIVEPEPVLTLTNHSDKLVIVRHVYPGIVHAGSITFDINSVFVQSAHAISAGTSRHFPIQPMSGDPAIEIQAEAKLHRNKFRHEPIRVASLKAFDGKGLLANSSRSFFG